VPVTVCVIEPDVKFGVTVCAEAGTAISNNSNRCFMAVLMFRHIYCIYCSQQTFRMSVATEEKKPGFLKRLKQGIDDKEEQLNILSTFVRLGILVWSGGILTLTYVTIPGLPQQKIDPTFIASVFTGTLATFGVQTAKNKQNGHENGNVPTQIIKIEQRPLKIVTDDRQGEKT
jgi:hypothetical protein